MADYQVTKVQTLPGPSGVLVDRLSGPGWTDTGGNVRGHLIRNAHRFYIDNGDERLWLAADPDEAGTVIVQRENGEQVPIESLPLALDEQMTSPLPRKAHGLWQRFVDAGSRL